MWLVHKGWLKSWEQVNHKNGVKSDNRISNFEKTDNAGNVKHAYKTGLNSGALVSKGLLDFNKKFYTNKYSFCMVDIAKMQNMRKNGATLNAIAAKFDCNRFIITKVLKYPYEYANDV